MMLKRKFHFGFLSAGMLVLCLLVLCANSHAQKVENLSPEQKRALDFAEKLYERIDAGLLIRSGAVYQDTSENGDSRSDIAFTSVELGFSAKINDYVDAEVVYLYEEPTFGEETEVGLDSGKITLHGGDACPGFISVGKMYAPFGALLTHFPDDPLTALPVTLLMGEINEKAALVGYEKELTIGGNKGIISLSAYTFNGDIRETGDSENSVDDFGADINFSLKSGEDTSTTVGGSYISNLADTDGITEVLGKNNATELDSSVDGYAAYMSLNVQNLFLDAEYMSAMDKLESDDLSGSNINGAEPEVWNIEAGFDYNWSRNLEVALKYAGSEESDSLDIPETRYGITFNQEIFDNTVFSVGALIDEFESKKFDDGSDDVRSTVFSQIEIEL